MATLKEQTTNSLTELLENISKETEISNAKTESTIDKTVSKLNAMFKKYWTPLFDEDKEYPLWNTGLSIYYGRALGDYFRLKETPINKIELVNSGLNIRETYPEALTKTYNKILLIIVSAHMYKDFNKELDSYEILKDKAIRHNIQNFSDFTYQIQRLTYDSIQENSKDNTLKINGQTIKVSPSISFVTLCYHKLKSYNVNDYRAYKNDNNEMSELLYQRLMIHQDNLSGLKETISQLVKVYTEICNNLLPESSIQEMKKQFISFCDKYGLDSNDYLFFINNWHNYKITFGVNERTPWESRTIEEYLKDNSAYAVLKSQEKGSKFDYECLELGVKTLAFNKFTRNLAERVKENAQSKLNKLGELKFIQKQMVKFGKEEIQISKAYSELQIIHNNVKFYSLFSDRYNFNIIPQEAYVEAMKQPFDEIKKHLEASAKVIEQFLNS